MRTPDDEKPLDPASAMIVAKMRKLMLLGGLTLLVGIGAVFAVIGYRVFKSEGSAPAGSEVVSQLPRGARVVSTIAADGRLAVTLDVGGVTEVRLFDLRTLRPAGTLKLPTAP